MRSTAIVLAACSSAAPPPRVVAVAQPAIEGVVRVSAGGAGVEGAMIMINEPHSDAVEFTDRAGHYRVVVPQGRYHVTMVRDNLKLERDVAVADRVTTVDFALDDRAAVAVRATSPICRDSTAGAQPALAGDVDALVSVLVDRLARDPDVLPDWKLLPTTGPIAIGGEVSINGVVHRLGAQARPFTTRPRADLVAEATHLNADVAYLHVATVELAGSCATVTVGVDYARPSSPGEADLCCCKASELYQRRDHAWTWLGRLEAFCR